MPRRIIDVDPDFGRRLAELRQERGLSYRAFGTISSSYVYELEKGKKRPTPEIAAALDDQLQAGGDLAARVRVRAAPAQGPGPAPRAERHEVDDEDDAMELARRVAASDVGEETIARLEWAMDDLATRYSITPPTELIGRVRRHLGYVSDLLAPGVRKTLDEHRRLLVTGAWLSLLGATIHIDLKQHAAADARLMTAMSLARQVGHDEIHAWCYETRAWSALTDGDYRRALQLSRTAQDVAPKGSSVAIQATAQEGRAWARLGQARETRDSLRRVEHMVAPLARPDRPEHHYRYDPDKATAYTATTLAWLGDPAAEGYARDVIRRLRNVGGWPRRVAAAQVDLSLALIAAKKHDEAAAATLAAITSGRIVPSNYWRAAEVVEAVEGRGLPEARDLRDAYETLLRGQIALPAAE